MPDVEQIIQIVLRCLGIIFRLWITVWLSIWVTTFVLCTIFGNNSTTIFVCIVLGFVIMFYRVAKAPLF